MSNEVSHCPKLPWMIDFYMTADGKTHKNQLTAAFAHSGIEHLSQLTPHSTAPIHRNTQIIVTIPNYISISSLEDLLKLGINFVRLKMTDFTEEKAIETISKIRHVNDRHSKKIGRVYPLGIMLDVRGTEIRTGNLRNTKEPTIPLEKGQIIKITTDPSFQELVTPELIYVDYKRISKLVQPGDKLTLDNGKVTLSAVEVAENTIKCIVRQAGNLANNVSVTLLNSPQEMGGSPSEYVKNIEFAIEQQCDAILMNSIVDDKNIKIIKEKIKTEVKSILIVAKIETSQAIDNIDSIIQAADAVLVGSEKLLMELPREKMFILQKMMIAKCSKVGKPCYCTVDFSDSVPMTKSEICDVASAIMDGADGIIVSCNVFESVAFFENMALLTNICREAEAALHQRRVFTELTDGFVWAAEPVYSLAISVVESSFKCNAAAIIVLTATGRSAKVISRFKPRCPIISITMFEAIARQLHLYRGIIPIVFVTKKQASWAKESEERFQLGITFGKLAGYIRMGDTIIVVSGERRGSGFTNTMKIYFASEFDTLDEKSSENA